MCSLLYVSYTNVRKGEHNHHWISILCNEYSLLAPWRSVLLYKSTIAHCTRNCSRFTPTRNIITTWERRLSWRRLWILFVAYDAVSSTLVTLYQTTRCHMLKTGLLVFQYVNSSLHASTIPRVGPVLSKSSRTVFFHIRIDIINKTPPPTLKSQVVHSHKVFGLNFCIRFHLSICVICLSSSFVVSKLMWQTCITQ